MSHRLVGDIYSERSNIAGNLEFESIFVCMLPRVVRMVSITVAGKGLLTG